MNPVKGALFDLDGLLLDSEPLWRKAQLSIMKSHNVPISSEECEMSAGLRLDNVLELWQQKYKWDTSALPLDRLEEEIKSAVVALVKKKGQLMAGARMVVALFAAAGVKTALVSSSSRAHIAGGLRLFPENSFAEILSGQDVKRAKPHPEIFLKAASKLRLPPGSCIAFEDSIPGLVAARAASMRCIVVPARAHFEDHRFSLADFKLRSLQDFRLDMLDQ